MEVFYEANDNGRVIVKADGKTAGRLDSKRRVLDLGDAEKVEIRQSLTGYAALDAVAGLFLGAILIPLSLLSGTGGDDWLDEREFDIKAKTGGKADIRVCSRLTLETDQKVEYLIKPGILAVCAAITVALAIAALVAVAIALCCAPEISAKVGGGVLMFFVAGFAVFYGVGVKKEIAKIKTVLKRRFARLNAEPPERPENYRG